MLNEMDDKNLYMLVFLNELQIQSLKILCEKKKKKDSVVKLYGRLVTVLFSILQFSLCTHPL